MSDNSGSGKGHGAGFGFITGNGTGSGIGTGSGYGCDLSGCDGCGNGYGDYGNDDGNNNSLHYAQETEKVNT